MSSRVSSRPLNSYLLRITEVRKETLSLAFELVELQSGVVRRFESLSGLRRFLAPRSTDGTNPQTPVRARRK